MRHQRNMFERKNKIKPQEELGGDRQSFEERFQCNDKKIIIFVMINNLREKWTHRVRSQSWKI